MEKDVLKVLSQKRMGPKELGEELGIKKIIPILDKIETDGLVFIAQDKNYSITLLGKILALKLEDQYKSITEKKELFDFFRTRIPSLMPDELLKNFIFSQDFQLIGVPDLTSRKRELLNKMIGLHPYMRKKVLTSAPILFKPGGRYVIAVLKKRPKLKLIIPEEEHDKNNILIRVFQKFSNWETKTIDPKNQYMGLLDIDDKYCFFGFRTIEDKPGWDALIYTENKDCIAWVKENFEYMWNNFAKTP